MMYRVVLADDEKWSLYGLSRMVDWAEYQCEISGMAYDGPSALEMCREKKPDLFISDIRMPGMDGLELARCMALEMPGTTVVLITGYSDLKYAQQALRLGVFDFLLKQITPEDLEHMLVRYLQHRQKEARALSCSFYFSFFDEGNTRSVAACMENLCIQAPFQYVTAMTFQYASSVVISHALLYRQEDLFVVAFHTGTNRITCFCFADGEMPCANTIYEMLKMAKPDRIGVSKTLSVNDGFYALYHQSSVAVLTAQFWQLEEPVFYQSWSQADASKHLEPLRIILCRQERTGAAKAVELLLQNIEHMQIDQMEMLLHRSASLFFSFGAGELSFLEGIDIYQYASSGGTWEELEADIHTALSQFDDGHTGHSQLMEQVFRYIDQHYMNDIRISDMAAILYLNASYLSTLIRKETGKTYTDILTEKRIACAKELLSNTDKTVIEVAHMVGYQEYSHFNTIFKRNLGVTPAQYRKQGAQTTRI